MAGLYEGLLKAALWSPEPLTLAERAGVWDKSDRDLTPPERAYRDASRGRSFAQVLAGHLAKAAAPYSKAADFHEHSDTIVEHYAPLIADALRKLVPKTKLVEIARKHKPTVAKAVAVPPASGSEDDASTVEQMIEDALAGVLAGRAAEKLGAMITSLYGDSALQGARHASLAAKVPLPDWVTDLGLPDDYWSTWQPGWGDAAAKVAGSGLKALLDAQDVSIKDMADTTLQRLGNALASGLRAGDPVSKVAQAAVDAGASPARASTIANTELARAMSATSDATYAQSDVGEVDWLAEDDACEECQDNADASPYALADAPDLPPHPDCRCAKAPH